MMTGLMKGLVSVVKEVGGMDMEEEVNEAYEMVKCIDMLDVSIGMSFTCLSLVCILKMNTLQRARRFG